MKYRCVSDYSVCLDVCHGVWRDIRRPVADVAVGLLPYLAGDGLYMKVCQCAVIKDDFVDPDHSVLKLDPL